MDTYFLQPNQEATLSLYNGTFEASENTIARDRMLDASIISKGKRKSIELNQWMDQDSTLTQLSFNTSEAGTYVVGVSTKARNIELTAEKFNDYLKHDGVLDMLKYRKNNGLLNEGAIESYAKHVKAIYQVGDLKTDDWKSKLGYPIEFIPQENPYEKYTGENLAMQLLLDGKPLANQLVYIDYIAKDHNHAHGEDNHDHDHSKHDHKDGKHNHDHDDKNHTHEDGKHNHDHSADEDHTHGSAQVIRTSEEGLFLVDLPEDGIYYLRTIHMVPVTDQEGLTHESKWATLTFEVTHKHDDETHTHNDEEGIPTWVFILGSVVFIGVLFLVFRRKN